MKAGRGRRNWKCGKAMECGGRPWGRWGRCMNNMYVIHVYIYVPGYIPKGKQVHIIMYISHTYIYIYICIPLYVTWYCRLCIECFNETSTSTKHDHPSWLPKNIICVKCDGASQQMNQKCLTYIGQHMPVNLYKYDRSLLHTCKYICIYTILYTDKAN